MVSDGFTSRGSWGWPSLGGTPPSSEDSHSDSDLDIDHDFDHDQECGMNLDPEYYDQGDDDHDDGMYP